MIKNVQPLRVTQIEGSPVRWTDLRNFASNRGAITLEYIIVSGFAALVSIAALAMIGKIIRNQMDTMREKMTSGSSWSTGDERGGFGGHDGGNIGGNIGGDDLE